MPRILVVEDRADSREFLSSLLTHFGYDVTEAYSATAALYKLRTETPDLIISDILMPDVDGYEFARQLRVDPARASIPILFWTAAYTENSARVLAEYCGVDAILAKPCEPEAILKAVRAALNGPTRALPAPRLPEFEREHARLLTNKIFDQLQELEATSSRLKESERQYRALFEGNPFTMWILDARTSKFMAVNEAAEREYGYTSEEFLAMDLRSLVVGAGADRATGRMRHRLKSGVEIEVECFEQATQFEGRSARVQLIHDVTTRNLADRAIRQSQEQLRVLAGRLRLAQEEERTRISRDLHDEMGQRLTALRMNCEWLLKKLSEILPKAADAERRKKLNDSVVVIDEMIRFVQKTATDLRPGILDFGIGAAIQWSAQDFQSRTEIDCTIDAPEDDIELDPRLATEVYRIFQEALTNVARHSGASKVQVLLKCGGGRLVLSVHDNGSGIQPNQAESRDAVGLLGMRERAAGMGAVVTIQGSPEGGTTVRLEVPLAAGSAPHGGGSAGAIGLG